MGNWNVTIRGVGPHHNQQETDVEQVAAKAVAQLKAAGHNVVSATVTTGGEIDLGAMADVQAADALVPDLRPLAEKDKQRRG
ncbi:MAG: hypothetical protein WAZ94_15195 [Phycisphaerales bacterium]|nr:hypothetical protein [Chloroflexota bacterium]